MFMTPSICLLTLGVLVLNSGLACVNAVETSLSSSEDYSSSDSSSLDSSNSKIDSARTNLEDDFRPSETGLRGSPVQESRLPSSKSLDSSNSKIDSARTNLEDDFRPSETGLRGSPVEESRLPSSKENKVVNYVEAFALIRKTSFWPLPLSPEESIVATFGPTVNLETKEYEFSRGVDIAGWEEDPVTAVYSGTVYQITEDEAANGLKEIVIKHRFPEWTQVRPENYNTKSWYSIYSHVETGLKEGVDVVAGEDIGQLGDVPHLHFELRVGTTCSLEDGIEDNCVTLGYDPHVHPLLVNEPKTGPDGNPELKVLKEIGPLTDGMIQISTSLVRPDINRYEVQVMGRGKEVKKRHVLDLNLRKGFDATSLSKLNDVDNLKPYLQPVLLEEGDERWSMGLVIPSSWVESKSPGDWYRLIVQDIWGKSSYLSFTSEYKAWCQMETLDGIVQFTDDDCAKIM